MQHEGVIPIFLKWREQKRATEEAEKICKAQQEAIKQQKELTRARAEYRVTCRVHLHGITSIQAAEIRYEECKRRASEAQPEKLKKTWKPPQLI